MVARFGYKTVMTTGLLIVTGAQLGLTQLRLDTPLWFVLVVFFFFGFGMGNVIAPASTVMQNVLPIARVGAGSAVQNTVRQVFGAFGIAIVGTLLATHYASKSAPALASLPSGARDAASQSIIATDAVLKQALAGGAPADAISAARTGAYEAFLSATHLTSWIAAGVVLLGAIIVFFLLPKISPPTRASVAVVPPIAVVE